MNTETITINSIEIENSLNLSQYVSEHVTLDFRDDVNAVAADRLNENDPNYGNIPIVTQVTDSNESVLDASILESINSDSNLLETRLNILRDLVNRRSNPETINLMLDRASPEMLNNIFNTIRSSLSLDTITPFINVAIISLTGMDNVAQGVNIIFQAIEERMTDPLNSPSIDLEVIRQNLEERDEQDHKENSEDAEERNEYRSNILNQTNWSMILRRSITFLGVAGATYLGMPLLRPILGTFGGLLLAERPSITNNDIPSVIIPQPSGYTDWNDVSGTFRAGWRLLGRWMIGL